MKNFFTPKIKGYIVSNLTGFGIIGIDKYIILAGNTGGFPGSQTLIYSEFVIIPVLMGIIFAWFLRNIALPTRTFTGYICINVLISILLSSIFLKEGVICLIIVSPLLFTFMIAGGAIGRIMFKKNNQTLNASIVSILIALFIIDSLSIHNYENEVSDIITINAPANRVWKNVVAFKSFKAKNKFWLFQIGMPSPVESTVEGYYSGSKRKCIFSNGYVFDEKIVTYDEDNNLTFDITHQPRDPEIMGHIDILRGQFLLKDNGNGTTTLTGNSWYRLYVFPVWYYDIWAKSITRNVHLRVMEHIKELSEAR